MPAEVTINIETVRDLVRDSLNAKILALVGIPDDAVVPMALVAWSSEIEYGVHTLVFPADTKPYAIDGDYTPATAHEAVTALMNRYLDEVGVPNAQQ